MTDAFFMRLALDAAWEFQGRTYPNPAVGCAIVSKTGALLSVEAHHKAGEAHAELRAVIAALKELNPALSFPSSPHLQHAFVLTHHQDVLKDATVYVTLEPCNHVGKTPSCATLLAGLHVKRVCIGTRDPNPRAANGIATLKKQGIEVTEGVEASACKALLAPFLAWQAGHFSFFKLAMSNNGVIDGGVITSEASRKRVHEIRQCLSLLAIGGNTVRQDRPILDARLCQGKAPDVLIYSRTQTFDSTIPLFHVPHRSVRIASDWSPLLASSYAMIEGGAGTLKALPSQTRWLLVFRSPHFKTGTSVQFDQAYTMVWQGKCGEDTYAWYVRV